MTELITTDHIVRRDAIFRHGGYPSFIVGCQNLQFTFYVLPRNMVPSLKGFTYSLIAAKKNEREPWQSAVFGMSEDVPEDYREYVAYYEISHRWYGMSCETAVQGEVHTASNSSRRADWLRQYAEWRQDFFTRLATFARDHSEPEDVVTGYEKAATYFYALQGTLTR